MEKEFKPIPIGNSDFQDIIEKDHYYVDKTLLIKELLDSGSKITLITRPRRFGKTLSLSMLKHFFEVPLPKEVTKPSVIKAYSMANKNNLFEKFAIWKQGNKYTSHYKKYPVISITLKNAKETGWKACFEILQSIIAGFYLEHSYLLELGILNKNEAKKFESILAQKAKEPLCKESLYNLTHYLHRYYNQKVIVLIDEYDTPVHEAFEYGFYSEIIGFLKSFLGAALKDNEHLEKAVITGILRVTKENLFSDLNNPKIVTILDNIYADKFGFTEEEVIQFLKDYEIENRLEDVRHWYNGYTIGNKSIYNPWSIINFVDSHQEGFKPYWINTSGNRLVNHLLARSHKSVKEELEQLIQNQPITKRIDSHIVFSDIEKKSENLWSFLLFTGYLKVVEIVPPKADVEDIVYKLVIPNSEVRIIYKNFVESWFTDYLATDEINLLYRALLSGDVKTIRQALQKYTKESMSFFDPTGTEPERVYHCFVLGLLLNIKTHKVRSNRESGFGRYDIMMIPIDKSNAGVVIEFKKVDPDDNETLETACDSALQQIQEKDYASELKEMGVSKIYQYGVSFDGKKVMVKK